MSENTVHQVLQLCSYLLSYPDQEFINSFEELEEELELLPFSHIKKELQLFCETAKHLPLSKLIAAYVNTFDFGKKTNLYITYMTNGEQRERGLDLLFLKNYYKLQGFDVTDKELPDYLPIMLEFAGQVDTETMKPVFERYLPNIQEIESHLHREENFYGHIMKSVLLVLKEAGISKAVRRSEQICFSNFSG